MSATSTWPTRLHSSHSRHRASDSDHGARFPAVDNRHRPQVKSLRVPLPRVVVDWDAIHVGHPCDIAAAKGQVGDPQCENVACLGPDDA